MRLNEKTAAPRDAFVFEQGDGLVISLPAPEKLGKSLSTHFDLFVCALGFEERCVAIPLTMSSQRKAYYPELKISIGLVGRYRTNADDNIANESVLSGYLDSICVDKQFVDADDPELVRTRLIELIKNLQIADDSVSVRVCFDISACSGTFILTVVGALLGIQIPIELSVLYCQAGQYFPTYSQVDADRLGMVKKGAMLGEFECYSEQGTQEPMIHPLYSGFQHEGRPDFVIAIPSFRMNRMVRCIDAISEQVIAAPESNVHWVFGLPNHEQDLWRNKFQQEILLTALQQLGSCAINGGVKFSHENSSDCCVFDYRKTVKLILRLADQHLGKNITCIPMGTKMQNLGVALALGARSEVSVTYARPAAFSPRTYSEGVGMMWELSLGPISKLSQLLSQVGTLDATTFHGRIGSFSSVKHKSA
ncbi:MAG: hypothetical protein WC736_09795 [Gallionella sp.]